MHEGVMRDRLIELIKDLAPDMVAKCGDECDTCKHGNCVGKLADCLLANGVIVPLVEIGQTVWYIHGGYYNSRLKEPRAITVTEINKKKSGKTVEWAFIANGTRYKFSSIGKSVFLSRKDCEAAIAERSEG